MRKTYVKVPVVMQMETLECGAACLSMVMAYYGKWLPLERVRTDCGVSRNGGNAKNILLAARSHGLFAKGYRFEPEDLKTIEYPAILHWNFNHFVVLCGFRKNRAVINDPALGTAEISMEELDRAFTGVCLMFRPTERFSPEGGPPSLMGFAKKRLKGTAGSFAFVALTGAILSIIGIVNSTFSRIFLDRVLGQNPEWLSPLLGAMLAAAAAYFAVSVVRTVYMLKIEGKLAIVANTSFMWHVLRLPMEFYSHRMAGDIADRQAANEGIAASLMRQLAPMLLNFALLIFYLTVMLRYSAMLTLAGVAAVLLNVLAVRAVSKKRINLTRAQLRDEGKLSGAAMSGMEMMETIKASGAENGFFERWAGYHASVNASKTGYARLSQFFGAVPGLLSSLANIAVLSAGVWLIMEGRFTPGMLLAFQGFLSAFMAPAAALSEAGRGLQESLGSMERIEDVMNCRPDVEYSETPADGETEYQKLSGRIELKNVTFGYSRLSEPLIKDFSLSVPPGGKIALVGPSGCGKSTLSKLISGLYKPWSGEILFDGKPLGEIPRELFTGSLAVVDQDIILFEDTISNNIKMWDSSIEDFEMILAARDARMHEDIMQRDGGYSAPMAEGGRNFSGGQRQRLEIARVLAQDPTILILDEATSALDAKTESEVMGAVRDRGITSLVIAHRLSAIRDCDEIIVIDRGGIAERGAHKELLEAGGLYSRLVSNE